MAGASRRRPWPGRREPPSPARRVCVAGPPPPPWPMHAAASPPGRRVPWEHVFPVAGAVSLAGMGCRPPPLQRSPWPWRCLEVEDDLTCGPHASAAGEREGDR
ncbi:unnamed protein product [Urochloa humidicola]